ncbi:unnamed protein product [Boreogadus saida]
MLADGVDHQLCWVVSLSGSGSTALPAGVNNRPVSPSEACQATVSFHDAATLTGKRETSVVDGSHLTSTPNRWSPSLGTRPRPPTLRSHLPQGDYIVDADSGTGVPIGARAKMSEKGSSSWWTAMGSKALRRHGDEIIEKRCHQGAGIPCVPIQTPPPPVAAWRQIPPGGPTEAVL